MFKYAIIGSGKQGTASAYDLMINGEADKILLIDSNMKVAEKSAEMLTELTGKSEFYPIELDVNDSGQLSYSLDGVDSIISGVPYYFNLQLTKIAIDIGANFCDFGGNTDVVKAQLELNDSALEKNISIVPDCGMDPGMNISFIQYLVDKYDKLKSVKSYGAGLLQDPKPPWNYGNALFLRDGKVCEVPCLTGYEILDFGEPLGKLEAAVTSGGLSTIPIELEGKVELLENKTLRYLGHWERFKGYSDLGLFEEKPIKVGNTEIIPREVYHALLEPQITVENLKDIGIIKIFADGMIKGRNVKTIIDLIDYYDDTTGFTAMQRLTGWHASTIAILAAQNKVKKGAVAVNNAVNGEMIIEELKKRGLKINILEE